MRKFQGATEALKLGIMEKDADEQTGSDKGKGHDHDPALAAFDFGFNEDDESLDETKDEDRPYRKDSQQSYTSFVVDVRKDSFGSSIESVYGSSAIGRALTCSDRATAHPEVSAVTAATADALAADSTDSMDGRAGDHENPQPSSSLTTNSCRNFSRPLSCVSSRSAYPSEDAGTQRVYPQLTYAESSRLSHSRHNAWTIRRLALMEKRGSTITRRQASAPSSALVSATADQIATSKYWRSQVRLLRALDASTYRTPNRVARAPTPCSSCSSAENAPPPPRPRTSTVKRKMRKWWRIFKSLPPPKLWFRHHKAKHPLVRYPRTISRNYSRADDWPFKNEDQVARAAFRVSTQANRAAQWNNNMVDSSAESLCETWIDGTRISSSNYSQVGCSSVSDRATAGGERVVLM